MWQAVKIPVQFYITSFVLKKNTFDYRAVNIKEKVAKPKTPSDQ